MAILEDELGDIVSKARVGQNRTVAELARVTSLAESDVEAIEAYRFRPGREQVARLAEALSLDPRKLTEIAEDAWSPKPVDLSRDSLLVDSLSVPHGGYGENCYVLGCTATHAAAVVDPGGAVEEILETLAGHGLTLELVLITHAHGDHIGGLKQLVQSQPDVRIVNHQLERDSVMRGLANGWDPAKNGVPIHLGSLSITPLFTPGHTPGSTCYLADGVCFVGDTLFAGSIGRPGAHQAFRDMLTDIRAKVLSLPDDTILLPGHGPATTVAEERAHNPFF